MLDEHPTLMRQMMNAADFSEPEDTLEDTPIVSASREDEIILDDLRDLADRLHKHTEDDDGEYSLGVEIGMQRAAEMVENFIRRHFEDREF